MRGSVGAPNRRAKEERREESAARGAFDHGSVGVGASLRAVSGLLNGVSAMNHLSDRLPNLQFQPEPRVSPTPPRVKNDTSSSGNACTESCKTLHRIPIPIWHRT